MWWPKVPVTYISGSTFHLAHAVPRRAPIIPISSSPSFPRCLGHRQIGSSRFVSAGSKHDGTPSAAGSSGSAVKLREYQADAIKACLDALDKGLCRIGVSSPTGSGKTTMFMHLIPAVRERTKLADTTGGGRTLILVSGIELATQTEAAARRILGDEWTIEVEQGNRKASGKADV